MFNKMDHYPKYLACALTGVIMSEKRKIPLTKIAPNGYVHINVSNGEGPVPKYVHRLIWEQFSGPIPDGMVIDHINGIRHDNRLENLRCVTMSENVRNSLPNRNFEFCKTNCMRQTSVKAICKEDSTETVYPSMYKCQQDLGINSGIIKMAISGQNNCKGGFSKINKKYYTFGLVSIGKHKSRTPEEVKEYQRQYQKKYLQKQKSMPDNIDIPRIKKQYNEAYYQKNKVKLLAHMHEKVECPCGLTMARSNLSHHKKTKKHILMMELINKNKISYNNIECNALTAQ